MLSMASPLHLYLMSVLKSSSRLEWAAQLGGEIGVASTYHNSNFA